MCLQTRQMEMIVMIDSAAPKVHCNSIVLGVFCIFCFRQRSHGQATRIHNLNPFRRRQSLGGTVALNSPDAPVKWLPNVDET
jgi:hypothetical protein